MLVSDIFCPNNYPSLFLSTWFGFGAKGLRQFSRLCLCNFLLLLLCLIPWASCFYPSHSVYRSRQSSPTRLRAGTTFHLRFPTLKMKQKYQVDGTLLDASPEPRILIHLSRNLSPHFTQKSTVFFKYTFYASQMLSDTITPWPSKVLFTSC